MTDDAELLRQYAEGRSEEAFAELVRRHLPVVYSAALRQVGGDAELAKDISQTVFVDLARKARSLLGHDLLVGWLYASTRFAAASARRGNQRRQIRERLAVAMQEDTPAPAPDSSPAELGPVLDDAMAELEAEDRHAVLLRFFQGKGLKEMGAALGVSEDAARMRVHRALEKLHCLLKRRGVALAAGALGTALATQAVSAAPAGLAASITGTALAGAAAGGQTTFTLLKILAMTKIKAGLVSAVVVAGLTTSLVVQLQARAKSREQDESFRRQAEQLAQLGAENQRLAGVLAEANNSPASDQLQDLPRLRTEAVALRQQTNDLARLREENRRLQQSRRSAAIPQTDLQFREQAVAKLTFLKGWVFAFHSYAQSNQGQFPASFEQAAPFLRDKDKAESVLTPDQCEVVYQGAWETLTNAANVIVIREKQAWQGRDGGWGKGYGFADGHSEIHASKDGDFEAWEKQHLIAPSRQ